MVLGLLACMPTGCEKLEPESPVKAAKPAEDAASEEAKEAPAPGDAKVTILQAREGGAIRYRLGDRETADIEELGRWLRLLKRVMDDGGIVPAGRIYAGHFTRHEEIVAVLQEFADAGFDKVDFYGGNSEVNKRLRYPHSDAR